MRGIVSVATVIGATCLGALLFKSVHAARDIVVLGGVAAGGAGAYASERFGRS